LTWDQFEAKHSRKQEEERKRRQEAFIQRRKQEIKAEGVSVMAKLGSISDYTLASELNVTQQALSKYRNGDSRMSADVSEKAERVFRERAEEGIRILNPFLKDFEVHKGLDIQLLAIAISFYFQNETPDGAPLDYYELEALHIAFRMAAFIVEKTPKEHSRWEVRALLAYLFEMLLAEPNPNMPKPTEEIRYDDLFEKIGLQALRESYEAKWKEEQR
jgi:transcriptional regulator with XRE-family HTH domain